MQTQTDTNIDAFTPTPKKNLRIWGRIDYNEWLCGFTMPVKDAAGNTITKGEKSPYNPEIHQNAALAIDLYIQQLPEINIPNARICEYNVTKGSIQWEKDTLPSLINLGVTAKEQIDGTWAVIEIIESKKTYKASSGEIKHNLSWMFVNLFADEDTCRADYLAAVGRQPSNGSNENAPVITSEDTEKATAFAFLKVIVTNAVRGHSEFKTASEAAAKALAQYPTVARFYSADSQETVQLMSEANPALLPF